MSVMEDVSLASTCNPVWTERYYSPASVENELSERPFISPASLKNSH